MERTGWMPPIRRGRPQRLRAPTGSNFGTRSSGSSSSCVHPSRSKPQPPHFHTSTSDSATVLKGRCCLTLSQQSRPSRNSSVSAHTSSPLQHRRGATYRRFWCSLTRESGAHNHGRRPGPQSARNRRSVLRASRAHTCRYVRSAWPYARRSGATFCAATLSADRQFGREGSLATDRETRDDALLVSVADDVDHVPVWGAHEEPADAPRFVGQRMNDLVAAALRFCVGLVDVVPDVH